MNVKQQHDSLRDDVGQIISDKLADGIDICDSQEIDLIADAVLIHILDTVAAAIIERAAPSDEIFVSSAIEVIDGVRP